MRSPPRRLAKRALGAAVASAIVLGGAPARASEIFVLDFPEPLKFDFFFWSQVQIGLSGAVADWKNPGGVRLHAAGSGHGLGLAAALHYERVAGEHGGMLALGGQLRPLASLERIEYRSVDPFVSIGGEIGGGGDGFRASGFLGAGVDISLFHDEAPHPAIVIEYQIHPLRTPSELPLQVLHVGAALRADF